MFAHRTVRRCVLAAATLLIAACGEHPTRPASDGLASSGDRVPSAAKRITGLAGAPGDQATLAALRAPWAWIGSVHHQAMQEILHDTHVNEYTGRGPDSPACAAQVRYMKRYAQRIAVMLDSMKAPGPKAPVDVNDLAMRVGSCTVMPTRVIPASTPLAVYATTLTASLQSASSLDEARRQIDAVLTDALHDPSLNANDLSAVAALTVVALSSTTEWYTLSTQSVAQRPAAIRQHTLQSWTAASTSDLQGCGSADVNGVSCAIGSIGGSLFSW